MEDFSRLRSGFSGGRGGDSFYQPWQTLPTRSIAAETHSAPAA